MDDFLQNEDLKSDTIKRHLRTIAKLEEDNINPLSQESTIITRLKQYTLITKQTLIKTIIKIRT